MGRVAQKQREKINEALAQLPEEVTGKCSMCNMTLLHVVKSIEAKTGAGTATITRELARVVNAGKPAGDRVTSEQLRARATHLEKGREKTSRSVPICRNPTDSEKNDNQVPPPKGEEKPISAPLPSTPSGAAAVLSEIDGTIQDHKNARPPCFMRHGSVPGCEDCEYEMPCRAAGTYGGVAEEEQTPMEATDMSTDMSAPDFDMEEAIREELEKDSPGAPKSDREIIQAMQRPAEWLRLLEQLKRSVAIDGKLRMNGLSPSMFAFDLTMLAAETNDTGFKAALEKIEDGA